MRRKQRGRRGKGGGARFFLSVCLSVCLSVSPSLPCLSLSLALGNSVFARQVSSLILVAKDSRQSEERWTALEVDAIKQTQWKPKENARCQTMNSSS